MRAPLSIKVVLSRLEAQLQLQYVDTFFAEACHVQQLVPQPAREQIMDIMSTAGVQKLKELLKRSLMVRPARPWESDAAISGLVTIAKISNENETLLPAAVRSVLPNAITAVTCAVENALFETCRRGKESKWTALAAKIASDTMAALSEISGNDSIPAPLATTVSKRLCRWLKEMFCDQI